MEDRLGLYGAFGTTGVRIVDRVHCLSHMKLDRPLHQRNVCLKFDASNSL
jgi:hypothetical protein